jgi:N-acetylmuramoyl-L-alanine amidase
LELTENKWILSGIWVWIFITLLLVTAQPSLASKPKSGDICLEGRQLGANYRFIEVKGKKYINLPFLRVYFHVATSWSQPDKELYFKFGTYNFKMYANKTTYYVNGKKRTLPVAPFKKDNDFWIPMAFFVRLGLTVKEQPSPQTLFLEWQENYLLGIENISYQERPAFLLIGAKNLNLKQYSLHNPERVVCELAENKPHFTLNNVLTSHNPLVKRLRVKTDPTIAGCLVFDLSQPASYQIIRDPKEPNQAIVIFNYFINDIQLENQDTDAKLKIKSSFPADYQFKALPDSNQLLIKLLGATFTETSKVLNGNNQNFGAVRINQDDPTSVSILIELNGTEELFVTRSRLDPTVLEVKSPAVIKDVGWCETKGGSVLTITSNHEITENVRLLTAFKQLQIDLENAQFDVSLSKILPASGPVSSICLLPITTNLARIELNLNKLVSYDIKASPDRHKITISLQNSHLAGKTIVIDPGHGGADSGACGKQNTREKEINLEVALKLKALLEMSGAIVLLTRNSDVFINLYERSHIANYHKADLFISIHANSHPDHNVRGIEIFHYKGRPTSKAMARKVLNRLTRATGLKPLGVKKARFVVIRETQMPSILIELGFLSNYQEESILKTTAFKEKAALGILQGLFDLYQN